MLIPRPHKAVQSDINRLVLDPPLFFETQKTVQSDIHLDPPLFGESPPFKAQDGVLR